MMKKEIIKNMLRENASILNEDGNSPHIQKVTPTKQKEKESNDGEYDKVVKLLDNDLINHAAIGRRMKGEEWSGSEATNRSKFRKKLKRLSNDEGSIYKFSDEDLSQIQKILLTLSSTISKTMGRQGK